MSVYKTSDSELLELTRIESSYAPTYDSRSGRDWSELFTEDGIYQARYIDGESGNFIQGRKNLEEFCSKQPWDGIHYMMVPQFQVNGDEATARVHFQYRAVGVTDSRVTVRNSSGAYDVAYVKVDGSWKMSRRMTSFFAETKDIFYRWYPTTPDMNEASPYGDDRFVDRRN